MHPNESATAHDDGPDHLIENPLDKDSDRRERKPAPASPSDGTHDPGDNLITNPLDRPGAPDNLIENPLDRD